jgi:flavodoxin
MDGDRILLVYYSRTGTTRQVGVEIARGLSCDIEAIVDRKKRNGLLGLLTAGKDALFRTLTRIQPLGNDPADYDLVIIGTPVWAGSMCPAVRTLLKQHRGQFQKVALFVTTVRFCIDRTLSAMAGLSGAAPVATFGARAGPLKAGKCADRIDAFIRSIQDEPPTESPTE